VSTVDRKSDALSIIVPDPADPADAVGPPAVDSWALGRARLVAFKAERLLSSAQRELGSFGEGTLSTDLAPDLLRASEHVGAALAVLAEFQARLTGHAPDA
jgi:hypothetical protein